MYIMELKRVIPNIKTFGVLKFSALRREVHIQNEDGTVTIPEVLRPYMGGMEKIVPEA